MPRQIILLRGINVGGHGKLPMADLRKCLGAAGFENVQTYIQSGNIILDSALAASVLEGQIADLIAAEFGFRPPAFALDVPALAAALAQNPLPQADKKQLHLYFLKPPVTLDAEALRAACTAGEEFALIEDVFYLATPEGMGRSKAAAKLDRYLMAEAQTARNLNSCEKLLALASA